MTIATLAELKTALASELHRDDLTTKLPDFILMGESKLNSQLRMLDMVTSETGTLDTSVRTLALPTRYQDKIQFRLNDPLQELRYVVPSRLMEYPSELAETGEPRFFTVLDTIQFDRIPDAAYSYTLTYYRGYRLSGDSDTNYLLQTYPQAYLYAACMYAGLYMRDYDYAKVMNGVLRGEVDDIKTAERKRRAESGATLVTEINTRNTYNIDQD